MHTHPCLLTSGLFVHWSTTIPPIAHSAVTLRLNFLVALPNSKSHRKTSVGRSIFEGSIISLQQLGYQFAMHTRINAVSSPGTRVYDGVVSQCDRMEYRRLNAAVPALGKMDPGLLPCGKHCRYLKRVLENSPSGSTIKLMVSQG